MKNLIVSSRKHGMKNNIRRCRDFISVELLLFFLISICPGCASKNNNLPKSRIFLSDITSAIPVPSKLRTWIISQIEKRGGDRLISIYISPTERYVEIWERWVENDQVVCNVYKSNDPEIVRQYEVKNEGAILLFSRLYDQTSQGFKCPELKSMEGFHLTYEYALAVGSKTGLVENDCGTNEFIIKDAVRFMTSDEEISFDDANAAFDKNGFASIATHISFAIFCFDKLCVTYYKSLSQQSAGDTP